MIPDRTKGNTIQDQIDDDYKTAYKAKDEKIFRPLRQALSAIKQVTIDKRKELNNEYPSLVISSEVEKSELILIPRLRPAPDGVGDGASARNDTSGAADDETFSALSASGACPELCRRAVKSVSASAVKSSDVSILALGVRQSLRW